MSQPLVPVSHGELIDKITILEIKVDRIDDEAKRTNVARELAALSEIWEPVAAEAGTPVAELHRKLREVNEALWDIEDAIRLKEGAKEFDERFIELARSVYITNDQRAALKRQVNEALGSALVEEKSYQPY